MCICIPAGSVALFLSRRIYVSAVTGNSPYTYRARPPSADWLSRRRRRDVYGARARREAHADLRTRLRNAITLNEYDAFHGPKAFSLRAALYIYSCKSHVYIYNSYSNILPPRPLRLSRTLLPLSDNSTSRSRTPLSPTCIYLSVVYNIII